MPSEIKRLKQLEDENNRLKRLLADAELDKAVLKEAAGGKLVGPSRKRAFIEHACGKLGVFRAPGLPPSSSASLNAVAQTTTR
jgi:hypothetical protein